MSKRYQPAKPLSRICANPACQRSFVIHDGLGRRRIYCNEECRSIATGRTFTQRLDREFVISYPDQATIDAAYHGTRYDRH